MRKLLLVLLLLGLSLGTRRGFAEDGERIAQLEKLLEVAVDRFQLNRYIEARAVLNRLIAENPTDEEAFKLRKLFGEKVLLEMQKYGNRPTLNEAERKVLQLLGEAIYAVDRARPDKASERLEEVVKVYKSAGYAETSFACEYAQELAAGLKPLTETSTTEIKDYAKKLYSWREQLQAVGNVPLVLLSRAQRYEQSQHRAPETVKRIVNSALMGNDNAQRNLLEITRLGVYAVPELLVGLRSEKSDTRRTNAHFILLSLGNNIILPLCSALKANDELFLQQLCAIIGALKPVDKRAVPHLKALYDNAKLSTPTQQAAGEALRSITGEDPKKLLPAADYFQLEANRYYRGSSDIDRELSDTKNTLWVWDPTLNNDSGGLREVPVPSFAISDLIAEELVYRGMELATDKTPFQVLLASILLQQKNRVDTLNKLLAREDLSHPEITTLRTNAVEWAKRWERNQRVVYTLGLDYLSAILKKALADEKVEIVISALDAINVVGGNNGWREISDTKPISVALENPNPRIAISAAITATQIGMPVNNPDYKKLLPLLVSGAQENRATVAEVITNNKDLQRRVVNELERGQVVPLVANDGYAGYNLAVQYPPKDAILIDNQLNQFNTLLLQLNLRHVGNDKVLPLTIITSRPYMGEIAEQFVKDAIEEEAKKQHVDAKKLIANDNLNFTGDSWRVITKKDFDSEKAPKLYEELQQIMRVDRKPAVIIIEQPNREERFKMKDSLLLLAERSLRPESLSEYAKLRNEDKVLGDIFGVRVTAVPVFVDEEIAGYDTMRTVQALQIDPRTRAVPVAILASKRDLKNISTDFANFIKDGLVEVLDKDISGDDLLGKISAMKKRNVLAAKNYARALSNDLALRSAVALTLLDTKVAGALSDADEKNLLTVAVDNNRPAELRLTAVKALGHFSAQSAVKSLIALFAETDAKEVALRAALIRAIGEIDTENKELEFKLSAMEDASSEIQRAAASVLGPAAKNQEQLSIYLNQLRPNDPLKISADGATPTATTKKEEKTEEGDDGEKTDGDDDGEKTDDDETPKDDDSTETKDDSGGDETPKDKDKKADDDFSW